MKKRELDFLTEGEERVVRDTARSWRPAQCMADLDVRTWLDVELLTGVHLDVQADPDRHRYRLEEVDQIWYLRWSRPKTGMPIAFPLNASPEALARVRGWIDYLRAFQYTTRSLQFVHTELGAACGIPTLCFLRFRHTAIERYARKPGVSTARLCELFGITPRTAMMYQRGPQRDRDMQDLGRIERWE